RMRGRGGGRRLRTAISVPRSCVQRLDRRKLQLSVVDVPGFTERPATGGGRNHRRYVRPRRDRGREGAATLGRIRTTLHLRAKATVIVWAIARPSLLRRLAHIAAASALQRGAISRGRSRRPVCECLRD